jgi:hypothetical protein
MEIQFWFLCFCCLLLDTRNVVNFDFRTYVRDSAPAVVVLSLSFVRYLVPHGIIEP